MTHNVWRFRVNDNLSSHLPLASAAFRDWPSTRLWLQSLLLTDLVDGDWSLALPRQTRQAFAEQVVLSLIQVSHLPSPPNLPKRLEPFTASDGSCIPANPKPHQRRSVTFSLISPRRSAVFSLPGRASGILQAEVYGLIASALEARSYRYPDTPMYTDHQNSERLINDASTGTALPHTWNSRSARSLYRWLKDILDTESPLTRPKITYTRAHTLSSSFESKANAAADALASGSHSRILGLPTCPDATFTMDEFTFATNADGFIESNIATFVMHFLALHEADMSQIHSFHHSFHHSTIPSPLQITRTFVRLQLTQPPSNSMFDRHNSLSHLRTSDAWETSYLGVEQEVMK
ncbi:hypothetical protein R3P38DRAFT_3215921 [Favolaschia claudopus]|uniref:Reverse transcriptase RNase H-like domain-containing protein n=1 Tax=Favolaschia claudopus TaxID=2862362 RepID=A0AAW0A758_9AGAR